MQLTNGEIWEARMALPTLMAIKFPVAVSYDLAMMASKVAMQLDVIGLVRNGIIHTYGEPIKDDPNENWHVPEFIDAPAKVGELAHKILNPKFASFKKEETELMDKEIDVDFGKQVIPVKLPQTVSFQCDVCKNLVSRPLELEPAILVSLEKFVGV